MPINEEKAPYILLADDDHEDQEMITDAILSLFPGTIINSVWNGQEVINFLLNTTPDNLPSLIILDYKMPIMSALDVLDNIGSDPRYVAIPKVVWSTSKQPEHIRECTRKGACQYFSKPDSPAELNNVVKEMFNIRDQYRKYPPTPPAGI